MTHVEMAAMAKKAGFPVLLDHNNQIGTRIYDWFVKFRELCAEEERAACVEICDEYSVETNLDGGSFICNVIADRIKERRLA